MSGSKGGSGEDEFQNMKDRLLSGAPPRPSPVVGYRWCKRGDPADIHINRDLSWAALETKGRAGGKPHGLDGWGCATRWPEDPREREACPGTTVCLAGGVLFIKGVGISAEPKQDPALQADEQWGEEFEI